MSSSVTNEADLAALEQAADLAERAQLEPHEYAKRQRRILVLVVINIVLATGAGLTLAAGWIDNVSAHRFMVLVLLGASALVVFGVLALAVNASWAWGCERIRRVHAEEDGHEATAELYAMLDCLQKAPDDPEFDADIARVLVEFVRETPKARILETAIETEKVVGTVQVVSPELRGQLLGSVKRYLARMQEARQRMPEATV